VLVALVEPEVEIHLLLALSVQILFFLQLPLTEVVVVVFMMAARDLTGLAEMAAPEAVLEITQERLHTLEALVILQAHLRHKATMVDQVGLQFRHIKVVLVAVVALVQSVEMVEPAAGTVEMEQHLRLRVLL
jgi:hypothetical protein